MSRLYKQQGNYIHLPNKHGGDYVHLCKNEQGVLLSGGGGYCPYSGDSIGRGN